MLTFSKAFSQLFCRFSQLSSGVDKHLIQDQPSFQSRHDPLKSRYQSGIRFGSAVCEDWGILPVEKKPPILSLPIDYPRDYVIPSTRICGSILSQQSVHLLCRRN